VKGSDVRVSSAISSRGHEHLRDRVTASADGAGNFTFRINDPNVGPYSFVVNVPRNVEMTSSGAAAEVAFRSMDYSAAGIWLSKMHPQRVEGAAALGVATGSASLPTTGTASYSGTFIGRENDDGDMSTVRAIASSVANFGSGVVTFSTTGSTYVAGDRACCGNDASGFDMTGSMTGVRTNSLRGQVTTKHGLRGEVRGNFYGPSSPSSPPPELAGSVNAKSLGAQPGTEGVSIVGGFVMKR
jgi:hypothetical protein